MNIAGLLAELEAAGVELWEESGRLRFRAPQGALTDERREALRAHKEQVLGHLRAERTRSTVVHHPDDRHTPFPLTDVQTAYLLGRKDLFAYGGVACHAYGELRFTSLDPARMEQAWQLLIERHDMLRAVVDEEGSQRVLTAVAPYRIEVTDLREATPEHAGRALAAQRDAMDHEIRPAGVWPLFELRATLFADHALLHVSLDFLIADYVSINLLLDELRTLYADLAAPLPELPVTFRDYLLAERGLRQSTRYERDRAYWLDRVDELPPAPAFPMRDAPAAEGPARFVRHRLALSRPQWQALRDTATARGLTPSGAVLAAYAEVIGRWCNRQRFTLDLTLLNRLPLHPQVGSLVGDFTSVELLEVDRSSGATFAERGKQLVGRLFEDLDHRLFTGVEVMREIARRRGQDAALMPVVFTSAIGLGDAASAPADDTEGRLVHGISQTPQVWIDCQVMEDREGLSLNWDVREGVLADGVVEAMFASFRTLVERMAADPGVWDLAVPTELPAEQSARRTVANATEGPLSEALLHEGPFAAAAHSPDNPAVISGDRVLTHGEVAARAHAVAAALKGAGCAPGDLVGVVMDKSWEQVVAVLGTLLAGAVYVPVDTHQPEARREQMLRDAKVGCALVRSGRTVLPEGVTAIEVDTLDPAPTAPVARLRAPDDLAYVIYTSGSTGSPKGVMISHRGAVNTIDDINERFAVGPDDRVLALANLGFDLSVYDVFGVLAAGGALVLPDPDRRADPSHWADLVARHGVTLWNSVPAQLHMVNEYLGTEPVPLPSLRLALLSGDWIPVSLPDSIRAKVPGLTVTSLGGATEASIWSILHPIDEVTPGLPSIPYGRPLTNQRFHVLDAAMEPCPDLVAGELYIAGIGLALGYLGDEARTAERFLTHPRTGERLYRTGDLGRYLPDGEIEFLGRDDRQVKIRGHRIETAEVEAALRSHPAVADCVVLVEGERPWERRLMAFAETARVPAGAAERDSALVEAVTADGEEVRAGVNAEQVVGFARRLDEAALLAMMDVLQNSGLFATADDRHSLETILLSAAVAPKHHRLVRRWLAALEREGYVERSSKDGAYRALRRAEPGSVDEAWVRVDEALPTAQDGSELLSYFRTATAHLPQLLRDEQDPVQLLFPEGRLEIQEAAYTEGFLNSYLNRVATSVVQRIAQEHAPRGTLRLLEVGAGVGGVSVEAVPRLAGTDCSYLFTDVSQFFLNKAAERFTDFPWVDYQLFDMNEEYRPQGIEPNSLDVILCGNVMHYSRNASVVLDRMREMLAPGGWLIFIETTRDNYQILTSMEFLFDATNGDFEDVRKGADQTFVARDQWLDLIAGAGGETVVCLPDTKDPLSTIGMHVFAVQFKQDRVPVNAAEVLGHVAERLPEEMVPAHLQLVDALPLTDNGKTDRRTLASWLLPRGAVEQRAGAGDRVPMTDLEQRIQAAWCTVLGTTAVGREETFYEAGGDSLLAAQVVGVLREEVAEAKHTFFDELLREVLNGASVARLAALLATGQIDGEQSAARESESAPAAPAAFLGGGDDDGVWATCAEGFGTAERYAALCAPLEDAGPLLDLSAGHPLTDYADATSAVLIERIAHDRAKTLRATGHTRFHLVGAHVGGVLAAETARLLAEGGAEVDLTVISSYPLPAVVEDDAFAEYLFALGAGLDPAALGLPGDTLTGPALAAVLAATPGRVPDGALSRLDGPHAELAQSFGQYAARPEQERLAALAAALGTDAQDLRPRLRAGRALADACAVHRPEAYAGDLTLVLHTDEIALWPTLRADMTEWWSAGCLGEVRRIDAPGTHFDCLDPARAARIAALLTDVRTEKENQA
ncbi:amino acid adenylation domain-containing protein [Streptomyces sp. NPDC058961]|uniref:amino acid adenylation domain-containing protein n=1 Tax=Streptomyces sp. NPDC058961 TaxID=3346680 RepID=UPI00368ADD95